MAKQKFKRDDAQARDVQVYVILGISIGLMIAGLILAGVLLLSVDESEMVAVRNSNAPTAVAPPTVNAQSVPVKPTVIAGRVGSAEISPDGEYLAVVVNDEGRDMLQMRALNVRDNLVGQLLWEQTGVGYGARVEFSPDSRWLLVTGSPMSMSEIRIYEVETGTRRDDPFTGYTHAAFSPDGQYLALASTMNGVRILDATTFDFVASQVPTDDAAVQGLAFSPTNKLAVAMFYRSESWVMVYDDVQTLDVTAARLELNTLPAYDLVFHPTDNWLAVASNTSIVAINIDTSERKQYDFAARQVYSVAFSPDGRWMAAGGGESGYGDSMLTVWRWGDAPLDVMPPDPAAFEPRTLTGHEHVVTDVVFVGNDRLLSAGHDGSVRLWNPQTGEEISRFQV